MSGTTSEDEPWEAAIAAALARAALDAGPSRLELDDVVLRAWQLWLRDHDGSPDT